MIQLAISGSFGAKAHAHHLALVWHLYGITGIEAGKGAIPSPVTIGIVPNGIEVIVPIQGDTLAQSVE